MSKGFTVRTLQPPAAKKSQKSLLACGLGSFWICGRKGGGRIEMKSPKKKSASAVKKKPSANKPRRSESSTQSGVVLLSGGNPQIPKGDGDAPVQAYIAAMPGWKREIGERLDAITVSNVPEVCKAVKWNSPLFGIEGQGFFLSFHVFTRYVKVTFFKGSTLQPVPEGGTPKSKEARWVNIHEGELDEEQMAAWIKQAAALPGWSP